MELYIDIINPIEYKETRAIMSKAHDWVISNEVTPNTI
jgi:hypothetical protein